MVITLVQLLLASDTTYTTMVAEHAGGLQEAYIVLNHWLRVGILSQLEILSHTQMATDFPTIGWLVALTVLFVGILLNSDFVLTYALWLFVFWLFCKADRILFGQNAVL